jgi:hypothetical protein
MPTVLVVLIARSYSALKKSKRSPMGLAETTLLKRAAGAACAPSV